MNINTIAWADMIPLAEREQRLALATHTIRRLFAKTKVRLDLVACVCSSVCVFVCLCVCFLCLSSVCLLSVFLSVCLFFCLSVCLYVCFLCYFSFCLLTACSPPA